MFFILYRIREGGVKEEGKRQIPRCKNKLGLSRLTSECVGLCVCFNTESGVDLCAN